MKNIRTFLNKNKNKKYQAKKKIIIYLSLKLQFFLNKLQECLNTHDSNRYGEETKFR